MVWQRAGTVSVQAGSTTVTGANVDFSTSSRNGDSFIGPDGANYEITNLWSPTVISILPAYKGATVSGAAYAIMPVQGYDKALSDAFNNLNNQFGPQLAALKTTGNYDILPISKGGTGRTALGNSITADVVTSTVDVTPGRLLQVGYGGIGALIVLTSPGLNDIVTFGYYYVNGALGGPVGYANGWLLILPINTSYVVQEFTAEADGSKHWRTRLNGTWQPWKAFAMGGANSNITALSGLTTALTVAQGGTGGKTQADARTGLGLGSASTLAAGSAVGNVQIVGDRPGAVAASINSYGNSYQIWNSSTAGAPEAGSAGTIINAGFPGGSYGSQILMSVTGRAWFRSGDYASAAMREIYHTGNTTRAADGTLKAI